MILYLHVDITEYRECFEMFDANGDGMISIDELEGMMTKFGDKPDQAELEKMMRSVDTDGNRFSYFYI